MKAERPLKVVFFQTDTGNEPVRECLKELAKDACKIIGTGIVSKKNNHRGRDFRDFLNEQGILGEIETRALKQALSLQLDHLLKKEEMTKTQMAARMKTSRAAVDRLLDASNSSVTLNTLGKAARALGRKVRIELVSA
jgi:predicted XRE-type DNA-binding protein